MAVTLKDCGVLIDPHTAVGVRAAMEQHSTAPTVVLSTAHPAKFPEAVQAATGVTPALDPRHADLMSLPERIDALPADAEAVKAYVRAFAKMDAA
jgi:threonine synthase